MKKYLLLFILFSSFAFAGKSAPPPNQNQSQDQQQQQDQSQQQTQTQSADNWLQNQLDIFNNQVNRSPGNIQCNTEPGFVTAGRVSYSVHTIALCGGYDNYLHNDSIGLIYIVPLVPKSFKKAADHELIKIQTEEMNEKMLRAFSERLEELNRANQNLKYKNQELEQRLRDCRDGICGGS